MTESEPALLDADPSLPTAKGRYGGFTLENDEYVVFDRQAPETWVQSTVTVDVDP